MDNKKVLENFNGNIIVEKLFWIAISVETEEFNEFIEEIAETSYERGLPEIANLTGFKECYKHGVIPSLLIENNKLGFIACLSIPEYINFKFNEKGEPFDWESGYFRRIEYVYSDTQEGLLKEIENRYDKLFEEFVQIDKESNLQP